MQCFLEPLSQETLLLALMMCFCWFSHFLLSLLYLSVHLHLLLFFHLLLFYHPFLLFHLVLVHIPLFHCLFHLLLLRLLHFHLLFWFEVWGEFQSWRTRRSFLQGWNSNKVPFQTRLKVEPGDVITIQVGAGGIYHNLDREESHVVNKGFKSK